MSLHVIGHLKRGGCGEGLTAWIGGAASNPFGSHSISIASRKRPARARGSSFCKMPFAPDCVPCGKHHDA